jgi:hypothetical protein
MTVKLRAGGIEAPPALTLKEIADKNGLLPIDVYEALRAEGPIARPAGNGPAQTPTHPQTPAQASAPAQSPAQTPAQTQPQAPAQASAPAQSPAQATAQPPVQTPIQTPVQTPDQAATQAQPPAPAPVQTQAQGQIPAQVPGQLPGQLPGNLPLPGTQPSATWQPGYERPASPAYGGPVVPPPDLEKTMLATFCREFDIPLTLAIDRLAAKSITAFGDMTFQELALENNMTPDEVMRILVTP